MALFGWVTSDKWKYSKRENGLFYAIINRQTFRILAAWVGVMNEAS
jgi:hypothetical protein